MRRPRLRRRGRHEPHVAGGAVRGVGAAGAHPIPVAVGAVAEIGAAPDDLGLPGWRAGRVLPRPGAVEAGLKPVDAPLPHVAGHVVQVEPVRLVGVHRRGAEVAVVQRVVAGELALPDVAAMPAARSQLVTPGEPCLLQPAAGGVLPLGLGRQPDARPGAVGQRVGEGDMHDRVVHSVLDRGVPAFGMAPVGPEHLAPPGRLGRASGGWEVLGQQPAEHERPAVALGLGHVPGRVDERGEARVGHRDRVDPEGAEGHPADRSLPVSWEAVAVLAAHEELAAIQQHHTVGRAVSLPAHPAIRRAEHGGPLLP